MRVLKLSLGAALAASILLTTSALAGKRHSHIDGSSRSERGSGQAATEERTLETFDRIEVEGSFDVFVEVGDGQAVSITADDNLLDNVTTEVRRNKLYLESERSYRSRLGVEVRIRVPSLREVTLEGSGDIEVRQVAAELFEIDLEGSGDIIVSGKVDEVEISLDGSGDVDASDLLADFAYVEVNGSGDVKVYAEKSLEGDINGSGDIDMHGDPEFESVSDIGDFNGLYIGDEWGSKILIDGDFDWDDDDVLYYGAPGIPSMPDLPELPAALSRLPTIELDALDALDALDVLDALEELPDLNVPGLYVSPEYDKRRDLD